MQRHLKHQIGLYFPCTDQGSIQLEKFVNHPTALKAVKKVSGLYAQPGNKFCRSSQNCFCHGLILCIFEFKLNYVDVDDAEVMNENLKHNS